MTKQQKLVLLIAVLASFVAFLDGSVVGVALPAISRELGGGLSVQQWVNDAYLITLGSLILIAGSFSDIFGRKKVITAGLVGFGAASLLCAIAPTSFVLIVARALQGAAGALLVPSSLALITSAFNDKARAKAIGSWTGWTGIAFIIGPLVGGVLVDGLSWRYVFAINVIPIAVTLWLLRSLKLDAKPSRKPVDVSGALLSASSLSAVVYALIEQPKYGWTDPRIYGVLIAGMVLSGLFVRYERQATNAMVPFGLFNVRNFSAGNIATFFIYGALSLQGFVLVIFLQQVLDYTAVQAGAVSIPVTILLFFLSSRFGKLSAVYGPRLFMTVGPIVAGLGIASLLRITIGSSYITTILPGIMLFGIGMSMTVAPLTSAILSAINDEQAGIGSAINNAVSRIAGLLAVALISVFIGGSITLHGFRVAIVVTSSLFIAGAITSFAGIRNPKV